MLNDDSYQNLVKTVLIFLQQKGPSKPKEIRKYLNQTGEWRDPPISAINKVLTQDLLGQVTMCGDGRWKTTQSINISIDYEEQIEHPNVVNKYNRRTKPHILFVCGKNKWRSPTAERIYKNDDRIEVRSAGMSGKSKHTISNADIQWADLILVMESRYKSQIMGLFRDLSLPRIENLDIPDKYEYMERKLIEIIEQGVEFHIQKFLS